MKSKRQQHWLRRGFTHEQIEVHLDWERRKSKKARERNKRNNEKNKKLIKQIKKDLIGMLFDEKIIVKINPTNDGVGFWYHCYPLSLDEDKMKKKRSRYFYRFEGYSLEGFIKHLEYV